MQAFFYSAALLTAPAAGLAAGLAMPTRPARSRTPDARLTVIEVVGSVRDVIAGIVNDEHTHRVLDATALRAAFLVGSPRGIDSIGEMVCVNGYAYACSTDPADLHATLSDTFCYTTGACVLPKNAVASHTLRIGQDADAAGGEEAGGGVAWGDVCASATQASSAAGGAVVYAGFVTFSRLTATQIAVAPVHGENMFEMRERYYSVPPVELTDVTV